MICVTDGHALVDLMRKSEDEWDANTRGSAMLPRIPGRTHRRHANDFVDTGIAFGCPLNNLMQEMSPLDEGFRARIAETLEAWISAFVVAAIEGSFGTSKNAASVAVLCPNVAVLADFPETLRAPRP